jgi:uroporphyrinogen decarboxylase
MIEQLSVPNASDLDYVMKAVRMIRQQIQSDLPLIGFSGSPWTLACYMIEGGSSRDFKHTLSLMYNEPAAMHHLLDKVTRAVIDYLDEQVRCGVNALMIFDTWGGILSTANFQRFSCNYLAKIVLVLKEKHPNIPTILFTKGGGQWLSTLASTGCDALSVDWTCDLARARREVGASVALQGNLDPIVLLASPERIREQVKCVLDAYGVGTGHVFNLGHGITPDISPQHVQVMVDAVHELSPFYHNY